jgi:nicotinamide mononucleotide (NMN) deamidase PncC
MLPTPPSARGRNPGGHCGVARENGQPPMSIKRLVREIHDTPTRVVVAVAGGGSRAVSQLLEAPGASRTVLEAIVPYSDRALIQWLGGPPEQACSAQTARAMAMAAFRRACRLDETDAPCAGVSCTASLATDRPKRGPHRVHLAFQTAVLTATQSLGLEKDRRSRAQEERIVARLVLNMVAKACGLTRRLSVDLLEGEQLGESTVIAPEPWQDLLLGRVDKIRHGDPAGRGDELPKAVFPGAFNPIHAGHRRMVGIARKLLGAPVELEISIVNVDKPPLDYVEIERRVGQLDPGQAVWLTRAATFEEKSRLFPGATFVVGADTLRRIADPRYYADDPSACLAALERIAARGCRFLVFGRDTGVGFVGLADLDLPDPLRSLCREVPADQFREDVSSTEIRKRGRR